MKFTFCVLTMVMNRYITAKQTTTMVLHIYILHEHLYICNVEHTEQLVLQHLIQYYSVMKFTEATS